MMKTVLRGALLSAAALTIGGSAMANHAWSTYHWSTSDSIVRIPIGDNVDSRWDAYLQQSMAGGPRAKGGTGEGWNSTATVESEIVAGATDPRRCKAAANRIEVCNAKYGRTGWLGIAGISISDGHITSGYTKLNDTYFDTASYDKAEWRMMVTCQEIGHDYGLGHTDEAFDNYNHGTCMDYTNQPAGGDYKGTDYGPSNEYINAHDADQLLTNYAHSHLAATNFGGREVGKANPPDSADLGIEGGNSMADWGRPIRYDRQGRPFIFEKVEGSRKLITHVFWALGEGPKGLQH